MDVRARGAMRCVCVCAASVCVPSLVFEGSEARSSNKKYSDGRPHAPLSRRISLACRFPFGMWRPLLHGVNENQHGGARLRRWGCGIDKDLLTRSKCAGNPQPDSLKEAPPYVFKLHGGGTRCGNEVRLQRPAQRAHSSQCRPGWLDGQQAAGD